MRLFKKKHKKKHKSQWKFVGIVPNCGIFKQVDVDKNGNIINSLNTQSIIIGKKNVCTHPCMKHTCQVCGRKITPHVGYFTGRLDLPEYCYEEG